MKRDLNAIRLTVADILRLLEKLVDAQQARRQDARTIDTPKTLPMEYDESELVTIKVAMRELCASRWKIDDMRRTGELQTIERNSRSKRLIRSEVELAKKWSHDKGKR